jgi:NAD(P)-dependent dehydrogenase (short-subunit alcohol dehydrogenase family)
MKAHAMSTASVWFITGCSTGLGRELAVAALKAGARVVATARDAASLAPIGPLSGAPAERLLALALDVNNTEQREHCVAQALERFGRIDVLVNNAGYGYQATAEEGDEAQIRALFDTDVFSVFALTRLALPQMRAQGQGHIIHIGSVAGLFGMPGSGYYAAAKHALEGWTDALATHYPQGGVWTFWDFQAGAWQRDHGFRIDHLLLSPAVADRLTSCGVDKDHRGREKASDHAPTWVELAD